MLMLQYPSADSIWVLPLAAGGCGEYVYRVIVAVGQKMSEFILDAATGITTKKKEKLG